jgi:hypothetical protein
MKRISFLLAALTLGLSTHASAWTGGPFDNGDYSILLERGGVYQCTFSFRNGSGMALFNENNSFETATGTTVTGMFSINNRSVFYYKGVTYFGTATGIVDVDARRVTGFTNGSSDYATTTAVSVNPQAGTGSARRQHRLRGQLHLHSEDQIHPSGHAFSWHRHSDVHGLPANGGSAHGIGQHQHGRHRSG